MPTIGGASRPRDEAVPELTRRGAGKLAGGLGHPARHHDCQLGRLDVCLQVLAGGRAGPELGAAGAEPVRAMGLVVEDGMLVRDL